MTISTPTQVRRVIRSCWGRAGIDLSEYRISTSKYVCTDILQRQAAMHFLEQAFGFRFTWDDFRHITNLSWCERRLCEHLGISYEPIKRWPPHL
ncbi:MAG: hypothetical protein AAGI68_16705 [Planctomycetota bacterium]